MNLTSVIEQHNERPAAVWSAGGKDDNHQPGYRRLHRALRAAAQPAAG